MRYNDIRAGSADCDVNAMARAPRPGDDWTFGEFSAATDLSESEVNKVEAVLIIARAAKDAEGLRFFHSIPVPLAIAIVKVLAAPDPAELAMAQVTTRRHRATI